MQWKERKNQGQRLESSGGSMYDSMPCPYVLFYISKWFAALQQWIKIEKREFIPSIVYLWLMWQSLLVITSVKSRFWNTLRLFPSHPINTNNKTGLHNVDLNEQHNMKILTLSPHEWREKGGLLCWLISSPAYLYQLGWNQIPKHINNMQTFFRLDHC